MPSESHALPRHLQGEHLQAALLDALAALFIVLAQQATLVVLLEDWHWADGASRAALGRMGEIVAARTPAVHRHDPARTGARSINGRHAARGFSWNRSTSPRRPRSSSRARLGPSVGRLARRVFERTGGNPFFLEQVCRALLEQGAVAARDGEAVVEGGPETAVAARHGAGGHPHAARQPRAPGAGGAPRRAVIGREFEHALLAEVVGADVDLAPAIARLRPSGLIRQTERGALDSAIGSSTC